MDSVVRSSFVPLVFGGGSKRKGRHVDFDGAFTDNNPVPPEYDQILRISPTTFARSLRDVKMFQFDIPRAIGLFRTGYDDANHHVDEALLESDPKGILRRISKNGASSGRTIVVWRSHRCGSSGRPCMPSYSDMTFFGCTVCPIPI